MEAEAAVPPLLPYPGAAVLTLHAQPAGVAGVAVVAAQLLHGNPWKLHPCLVAEKAAVRSLHQVRMIALPGLRHHGPPLHGRWRLARCWLHGPGLQGFHEQRRSQQLLLLRHAGALPAGPAACHARRLGCCLCWSAAPGVPGTHAGRPPAPETAPAERRSAASLHAAWFQPAAAAVLPPARSAALSQTAATCPQVCLPTHTREIQQAAIGSHVIGKERNSTIRSGLHSSPLDVCTVWNEHTTSRQQQRPCKRTHSIQLDCTQASGQQNLSPCVVGYSPRFLPWSAVSPLLPASGTLGFHSAGRWVRFGGRAVQPISHRVRAAVGTQRGRRRHDNRSAHFNNTPEEWAPVPDFWCVAPARS